MTKRSCKTCGFGLNPGGKGNRWWCQYIIIVKNRRPCPPADGCECWKSKQEVRAEYSNFDEEIFKVPIVNENPRWSRRKRDAEA